MFINHIYRHARDRPDSLAVVNSGEEISYSRFANSIEDVRNFLMRTARPRDGVIVNITSNLYHDWVLLLAMRSLGHTTLSSTSMQVVEILDLRNIAGLVCTSDQEEVAAAFRSARPDCAVLEVPRSMLAGAHGKPPPLPVADHCFGDHIVYTSGTTGTYKKLLLKGDVLDDRLSVRAGMIGQVLDTSSLYYGYNFGPWSAAGYGHPLRCWSRGAAIIFEQRADWTRHFFDYPVTISTFVPPLLDQLCKSEASQPSHYPRLMIRLVGGFANAELAELALGRFNCDMYVSYGGTEFGSALLGHFRTREDFVWLTPNFEPGIEIVDDEDCQLPAGAEGYLRVRTTPSDPDEYLDDPETTSKYFRDGYFYPGDMAVRREDGRIRILGRVADVLNLGGLKIPIEPFESWAREMLRVDNLCVFNRQSDDGGDMLIVVVEGDKLPDRARLQAMARRIRDVPKVRFALVGRFPRGEAGMMKVNRRKLTEMVRDTT